MTFFIRPLMCRNPPVTETGRRFEPPPQTHHGWPFILVVNSMTLGPSPTLLPPSLFGMNLEVTPGNGSRPIILELTGWFNANVVGSVNP
jgi:hypothetical protein